MEEGKKHIDDLFREGLEGYREMPDAAVWTSIEQHLPEYGHRHPFRWLWVLLMLALLSSLGYYAYKHWNSEPSSSTLETSTPQSSYAGEQTVDKEAITEGNNFSNEKAESNILDNTTSKQHTKSEISIKNDIQTSAKGKESADADAKKLNGSDDKMGIGITNAEKGTTPKNTSTKKGNESSAITDAAQNKEKETTATKDNSSLQAKSETKNITPSNKQNVPDPNKEIVTNAKAAASKTEKQNATQLPLIQEEPTKQKSTATAEPNTASKQNAPDPDKETVADTKTSAATKNENTQQSVTEVSERAKGIPLTGTDAEKGKQQPVTVLPEPAKGKPVVSENERAKGIPVNVTPEPDAEKSPIDVNAANAQKKPLYIEPVKESGIKISQDMEDDAGGNEEGEKETPSSGGGGGGGDAAKDKRKKDNRFKLDGGVKLGYDRGFADITTSNFTGNLFLQWNISPKTSLVLQPGVRYHSINKTSISPQSSFHDITAQSLDSAHVYADTFGIPNYFIQRNYIYRNTYDSIIVSYAMAPQKYVEVELPLLLQYKPTDNVSILGGIQLAFGQVIQIQSSMQRYQGNKIDTLSFPNGINDSTQMPDIPGPNGYFTYNTPSISELDENKYKTPITNPARFGAMLGFSYEYRRRLLIDLLVRKNLSDLSFIPNEEVRRIYSQPYFRITVGYKLFQSK